MDVENIASLQGRDQGPSCSLTSLLAFGCRSRAESLAHKLQSTFWNFGHLMDNGASNSNHQLKESIIHEAPKTNPGQATANAEELSADMENTKNINFEKWMKSYSALNDNSQTGTPQQLSDSDQFFDFGILSPTEVEDITEDKSTLTNIIINEDDGLPIREECAFGNENQDSDESDTETEGTFYDVVDVVVHEVDTLRLNQVEHVLGENITTERENGVIESREKVQTNDEIVARGHEVGHAPVNLEVSTEQDAKIASQSIFCKGELEDVAEDASKEIVDDIDLSVKKDEQVSRMPIHVPPVIISRTESIVSVEDDDEDEPPQRVIRSTSLKSGKTPPSTPGGKKIVRFADALGLDLALVRTFLDEIPNVPRSAFNDLEAAQDNDMCPDARNNSLVMYAGPYAIRRDHYFPQITSRPQTHTNATNARSLIASFTQPVDLVNYRQRLERQKVCLQMANVIEDMTIRGYVQVINLDFYKNVFVRYSTDEWSTFDQTSATYMINSSEGRIDRFSFTLFASKLQPGQRLFFAICYQVAGQEFWDNNFDVNYMFQCISSCPPKVSVASPLDHFLPYM